MLLVDPNPKASATEEPSLAEEFIYDRLRVEGANLFMQEVYSLNLGIVDRLRTVIWTKLANQLVLKDARLFGEGFHE